MLKYLKKQCKWPCFHLRYTFYKGVFIFSNAVKKRLSLAALTLAAIAQPSFANPAWQVKYHGGLLEVEKTVSGVTVHNNSTLMFAPEGLEFFVDDGDLKVLNFMRREIHIFDKDTGNLSTERSYTDWVEIPIISTTSLSDSNGKNIIRKDASGAIHIGENSLVTIEEGGVKRCGLPMQLVRASISILRMDQSY